MIKTNYQPTSSEIALSREASMSSMAIGIGLTHIRQYSFAQSGFFYSGLLSFTSGIERLAKIILIYSYRLDNNDTFPNDNVLKRCSHNLGELIEKSREINVRQSVHLDDSFFDNDQLYQPLLPLLTDFAMQARYYNLDYLSGKKQSGTEPLTRWEQEICTEIIRRHYRPNRKKDTLTNELAKRIETKKLISVLHTREDGTGISNVAEFFAHGNLIPIKQKYSMYYLYTIARFLSNLCIRLEFKGDLFPPHLEEFFTIFMNPDQQYILGKRIWIPAPR